jgi:hypothetical protein
MSVIITRTYSGAIDLYHGIPNLLNATVEEVTYNNEHGEYETTLVLKDINGKLHSIIIADAN